MTDREFVSQLIALRVRAGLRQADIAEAMGVSRVTVARFETASLRRRSPSLHVLSRYARAVGAEITLKETACR